MIAARRPSGQPPIRTRDEEPRQRDAAPRARKKQRLLPAGQRSGSGSASVLPYLSLPR